MTMEDMRRGIKRHRKVVLVVIIVLIVGLVASFAFMGAGGDDFSSLKGGTTTEQVQAQIDALEEYIAGYTPADGSTEYGFSDYSTLASSYKSLSEAYMQLGDGTNLVADAKKAAENYQLAYDNAPEELNNKGRADLIAGKALMLFYAGDNDTSKATFKAALEWIPEDLDINYQYASVIYYSEGLDPAVKMLTAYKESLPEGDANRSSVDQIIEQFKANDQAQKEDAAAAAENTNDTQDAKSTTDSSAEGAEAEATTTDSNAQTE